MLFPFGPDVYFMPISITHIRTDEVVIYRLCIFTLGNYKPFPLFGQSHGDLFWQLAV